MYLNFSRRELREILISVVVLSIVFSDFTVTSTIYSFIAVGFAFTFHEMGHRFVANRYGFHAEYRMWVRGLMLALLLAVISRGSFVFAAPGAVVINGIISRDRYGKIALAGPIVNVILAVVFLGILFVAGVSTIFGFDLSLILGICSLSIIVNLFLAAFNMLPFTPLDGASVMAWNRWVWAAIEVPLIGVMLSLMFLF